LPIQNLSIFLLTHSKYSAASNNVLLDKEDKYKAVEYFRYKSKNTVEVFKEAIQVV
jgi:hypothetical protein